MVLEVLRQRTLPPNHVTPGKRIFTDSDVELWKTTQGYVDYGLFVRRLGEAVIGHYLPYNPPAESVSEVSNIYQAITSSPSHRNWPPGSLGNHEDRGITQRG